jgi:hypothetical protein
MLMHFYPAWLTLLKIDVLGFAISGFIMQQQDDIHTGAKSAAHVRSPIRINHWHPGNV